MSDLSFGEDDDRAAPFKLDGDKLFSARTELSEPLDALGLSGMMVLPQSFGSMYLGESFCSYISVGNHSNHDVTDVIIKADLQTERQRISLTDNTRKPVDVIAAGGRHDFIIEHDIKELGAHTLICSATYYDISEQKHLPQYFKFVATNPLSVRTKVRPVKDVTFLELCIENNTKSPFFLDHVRFDPTPAWTVTSLEPREEGKGDENGALSKLFKPVNLIRPGGGTRYFLYQLTKVPPQEGSSRAESSNSLGKLEIMWRTTLGEPGRLQTQQIHGSATVRKEVELRVVKLPPRVVVECPFILQCCVKNCTDRKIGPLRVSMSQEEPRAAGAMAVTPPRKAMVVSGAWTLVVPGLDPNASEDFNLCLVALAPGVLKIGGVGVTDDRDGKPYDSIAPVEVLVEPK